jgi:hypothetical protein
MKDTDIIKALECCSTTLKCEGCPYTKECWNESGTHEVMRDALALITRQKAEIETWEHRWEYLFPSETPVFTAIGNCVLYSPSSEDYDKVIDEIGAEAIKDVAERVKQDIMENYDYGQYTTYHIDALVAEMVGERE